MKLKDETKKASIRQATLNVVLKNGIAGVKMARIAKDVNLSVSTLYVYHKNKEELLTSIYLDIFRERLAISNTNESEGLSFVLRLNKKWLTSVNFSTKNYRELNFVEQMKRSPYYEKILRKIKAEKHLLFDSILEEGRNQKLIKNVDNQILMSIYIASVRETSKLIMNQRISNNKKDMDLMFSFFWDSIKS